MIISEGIDAPQKQRMGAKQSTTGGSRLRPYQHDGAGHGSMTSHDMGLAVGGPSTSAGVSRRTRTRSLGIVQNSQHGRPLSIPHANRDGSGVQPPDSDASTPEDEDVFRTGMLTQASSLPLPMRLFSINGKCTTEIVCVTN